MNNRLRLRSAWISAQSDQPSLPTHLKITLVLYLVARHSTHRVGSQVVFAWIHCTDFSNTLYGHSDRMLVDFSMFSHLYPESYTPFSGPHFPYQTLPG